MVGFRGPRLSVEEATDVLVARQRAADQARSLEELRRQQAAFRAVRQNLDRENGWMAIPAVAPAAVVLAAEAAAAMAARTAAPLAAGPLALLKRDPVPKVGDNWATRKGRLAHRALEERVAQKDGWDPEFRFSGGRVDAAAPARNPIKPNERYFMELKPNTPSGRKAGAKQIARYKEQTGNKGRVIYYDPNDF